MREEQCDIVQILLIGALTSHTFRRRGHTVAAYGMCNYPARLHVRFDNQNVHP